MAKKQKKPTHDPREYVLVHKRYLKRLRARIAALETESMFEDTPAYGDYVLLKDVLKILDESKLTVVPHRKAGDK